jgi:uncharacterized repeat protein (TIGR01451 family)
MKTSKFLVLGMLALMFGMVNFTAAQPIGLSDILGPSGETFEIGENICYEIILSVPPDLQDLVDVNVYFFDPCNPPTIIGESGYPCLDPESGVLIAEGITLLSGGAVFDINCLDDSRLAHLVTEDNLTDWDGAEIKAYIATTWTASPSGLSDCDPKPSINGVVPPEPCIEVTKEVNCDISKAGDPLTYTICIENCGPTTIIPTSIYDDVLGELLPHFEGEEDDEPYGCWEDGGNLYLLPGEYCCLDFPYTVQMGDPDPLVNTVTFEAIDEYGTIPEPVDANATVDIVHPSFIATKDCRTDPLAVGDVAIFDIRIENDGDVCLRFALTELGDPCSFDLPAGDVKEWETHIEVVTEDDIFNEVVGTAILIPGIDPEDCGDPTDCLDNVLIVDVNDTCEVGGGATRTPGYWKTHSYMAKCMFDMCYPDGIDFGWIDVNDVNELMAVFYVSKAKVNKIC